MRRHLLLIIAVPLTLIAVTVVVIAIGAYSMMTPEDWEGFKTCQGNGRHWDSLTNRCIGPE